MLLLKSSGTYAAVGFVFFRVDRGRRGRSAWIGVFIFGVKNRFRTYVMGLVVVPPPEAAWVGVLGSSSSASSSNASPLAPDGSGRGDDVGVEVDVGVELALVLVSAAEFDGGGTGK